MRRIALRASRRSRRARPTGRVRGREGATSGRSRSVVSLEYRQPRRAERYHPKASGSASVLGSRRESQFDDLARIVSGLNRGPTVAPSNSGSGQLARAVWFGMIGATNGPEACFGARARVWQRGRRPRWTRRERVGRFARQLAPDQDRPWLGRPNPPRSPSRRPSIDLPLGGNSDQGLGGSASPSRLWHAGQRGAGVSRWLRA